MLFSFCLLLVGCRSEKGVTIFNPNPEAQITSHQDGDQVQEGTEVLFVGNVSDPNHGPEELRASWVYGGEELCSNQVPDVDGTTTCTIVMAESTDIVLEVQDPDNARGSDMRTLTIVPSAPPVAEIVRPEPTGVFYSDQKVTLEGVVSDAEEESSVLLVQWDSDIDGLLNVASTPDASGVVVGASYLSEGEHFLKIQVEDSSGKIGFDDVTIRVGPPNSPPECSIVSPQDGDSGGTGELVSFTGTASDVNVPSTVLQANWTSSIDGELGGSTVNSDGSILFPYADLSSGTHVLTLVVEDERQAQCTSSIVYTVGTAPSVDISSPFEGEIINEGELLTLMVLVSDQEDSPASLDVEWKINGSIYSTQGALSDGTSTIQDTSMGSGAYSLQVIATDSDALSGSATRNFTINALPSAPQISIQPSSPTTTVDLTVQIDVPSIDPEGSAVSYVYEWFQNGISQGVGTTIPASDTSFGDTWSVRVTPSDGIGNGAFAEASIEIQNTNPSLSNHQIIPSSNIYNDTVLQCSAAVSDADEALSATFSWYLSGTVIATTSSIDLGAYAIVPGDTITCRAHAVDSQGVSVESDVSVSVENRAPVIDFVQLTPSVVYTDSILSVSSQGSDADGENVLLSYEWYVDSVLVKSGLGASLDGSVYFSKGNTVFVRVIPSDAHGVGTTQDSSLIVIENTPPQDPSIAFLDGNGSVVQGTSPTDEDLQCGITMSGTDADGDTLTYTFSWSVGGVAWTGGMLSNQYSDDGISSLDTSTGEEWTCTVDVFDGQSSGASVQTSINIGAQFVWEEVGTESVEFAYGSCSSTQSNTITCSANHVGKRIYVHTTEFMGSKRLQYKVLGQLVHHGNVLMDVPGARGYVSSISTDETQITWTGAVSCGADSIVTRSATVYECVEY